MSDIDFDELDRAVASVINKPNDTAAAIPTPAPTLPPAVDNTPTPVVVRTAPAPVVSAPVADVAPKPAPVSAQTLHGQPVRPPRGRFLDFVQPGADKFVHHTVPTPPARPVAPSADSAFVSDVIGPAPAPVSAPAQAAAPQPVVTEPVPEPAPAAPDFFAPSDDTAPIEPLVSRFIPDAKVEKRPLGAWSGTDQGDDETMETSVPLPAGDELHDQLVKVESEDQDEGSEEALAPVQPLAPIATSQPAPVVAAPAPTPVAPRVVTPAKVASAPVRERRAPKPRPEKAPKYGTSFVIWVTVVVAVMLIGFGVGATLYFFFLK